MPRAKNLARQPVNNLMEFLLPLLMKNREAYLLEHVHCTMQEGRILNVNCYNEPTLAKLRAYQSAITDDLLKALDVTKIIFRSNPHYAVFQVVANFEKAGIMEFTLDQLLHELAAVGEYSIESIKGILRGLTVDIELQPSLCNELSPWLVPFRKEAPILIKTKVNQYKLFRKPKPEPLPEPAKKASSKKAKQR
jgi:hypothetical protein